ncbi:Cytochrome P450 [Saccharopolyspora antimicrobica]|uniref:Cytochrome P450 n=1 Tax=Saccharopolyspora antimicrobica TaxID=455193 RepID=A0A1I4YW53_9PSEU|nr:cytochrome P450 [Saccharopolyspora antimicrobica]RKT82837.1 cytochrome P450 [Saccharopolyspora antimicrobica]SFN42231.1 Cytochrome P450 [Saccharopolyspora antimicrobica]
MTTTEPRAYPFSQAEDLDLDPLYAELRRQEPLSRIQLPYGETAWLATRYEDAKIVLGDPRFSRAAVLHHDEPRMRPNTSSGGLLTMDPPEHTRLRKLAAKAFTARRVERMRPHVEEIADGLVDGMLERGAPADLVEDFALPLPITVICEMLGVPYADRADFRVWSDAFLSTTKLTAEQVTDYIDRMLDYMAGLVAERRAEPADDLLSALIAARDEQDKLSEEELVRLAAGILVAGHETTASQIPNFVYVLLTHPDQLAELRANPDRVPGAVEELMRFVPLGSGAGFPRYATEDVELGGVLVRAGEPVMVSTSAANRDETVFSDPELLDLTRQEASHIGFGHGPHHCLGAQLARMELQVALSTLLARLPGLRFATSAEDVEWKRGMLVRGPQKMLLAWQGGE